MKRIPDLKVVNLEDEEELSALFDMPEQDGTKTEDDFMPLTEEEARFEAESALLDLACTVLDAEGPVGYRPAAAVFRYGGGYQYDVTRGGGRGGYLVFGDVRAEDIVAVYLLKNGEVVPIQIA
jgi:hypothetical protein